ncbi:hypothetical protein JCM10213_001690 [Rhodosporidiobolus nylandii]
MADASEEAPAGTLDSEAPSLAPADPPSLPTSPVCYVRYGDRQVKARIDREVPLEEIIKQLAQSTQLAVNEPAGLFALREKDTGALVTEENLNRMLAKGNVFDLCSSPTIEAVEMVDKLSSAEPSVLKLATFSLRTLIQERAFLAEFIARGGLDALQDVIRRSGGNTLAYSLLSLQNLLELDERGWTGLERSFIARIVEIIATEPLINISRPATAILRRIASQPAPPLPLTSLQSPTPDRTSPPPSAALSSGFSAVYSEILQQPNFLAIVIERLSSGDVPITNSSLALVDTLLQGSTEIGDLRLVDELDTLDAWKVVGKLLTGTAGADIPTLLSLQSDLCSSLRLQLLTQIDTPHYRYFDALWIASGLEDTDESNRWRRLGFRTESPQFEFDQTGLLGLKMLARYAGEETNEFAASIADQLTRPESRRCPISAASNTSLSLLATFFQLLTPPSAPPLSPNPYLFRFPELHALVTQFFLRMWVDSSATIEDYDRIAKLVASQIALVLGPSGPAAVAEAGSGGEKSWFKVRQEFLGASYREVRERQMREMEIEDDILGKAPVRNLRGRLYLESYEFVRAQRIACLHEGAWFSVVPSTSSGRKATPQQHQQGKRWRFYRLAANRQALHWVEAAKQGEIRPGLEDLPERLDLALVTDLVTSTTNVPRPHRISSSGPPGHRSGSSISHPAGNRLSVFSRNSSDTVTRPSLSSAPDSSSHLSFTLHTADGPLVTLSAPYPSVYSEWVDGLALLRPSARGGGGGISTAETAEYVQALTDIGVKIKLLDLSGERVEIPASVEVKGVPRSSDFFYADSL